MSELRRPWFCPNPSCEWFYQAQVYDPPRLGESGDCFGRMDRPIPFTYDGVEHVNDIYQCQYSPLKGVVCWQVNREDLDAFRAVYENAAWFYDAKAQQRDNPGQVREGNGAEST